MIGQSDFLRPPGMPTSAKANSAGSGEKPAAAGDGAPAEDAARPSGKTDAKAAGRDAAEARDAPARDAEEADRPGADFSALMAPPPAEPKEAEAEAPSPRRAGAAPQMIAPTAAQSLEAAEAPGSAEAPVDAPAEPGAAAPAPSRAAATPGAPAPAGAEAAAPADATEPADATTPDMAPSAPAERPGAAAETGDAALAVKPENRSADPKPAVSVAGGAAAPADEKMAQPADPEPEAQPESSPEAAPEPPKASPEPVKAAPNAPVALAANEDRAADGGLDPLDGLSIAAAGRGAEIGGPRGGIGAPTLLPGAPDPRIAAQLSSQIGLAVSRADGDRVEVRLDPPELGRVRLSFTMKDDGVIALISVDRPEVLDLMRRHGELLQRDLTSAGYRNVTLDFAHSGDGGGAQRQDGAPSAPPAARIGAASPAITAVWRGGADDRLDIRL